MQRDRERVERLSKALGPELLTDLVEEISAISQNVARPPVVLGVVGKRASDAGIPPEDLLIATRELSHDVVKRGTEEHRRLEYYWHQAVRALISAYYSGHPDAASR